MPSATLAISADGSKAAHSRTFRKNNGEPSYGFHTFAVATGIGERPSLQDPASALALSPGGDLLAIASGNVVSVRQVEYVRDYYDGPNRIRRSTSEATPPIRVVFLDAGRHLAIVSPYGVDIWDLGKDSHESVAVGRTCALIDAFADPKQGTLVLVDQCGSLISVRTGDRHMESRLVLDSTASVIAAAGSPNGGYVALLLAADQSIAVFRTTDGARIHQATYLPRMIRQARLTVSNDGRFLGLAFYGKARLWDWTAGSSPITLASASPIDDIAITPDGERIIGAGSNAGPLAWTLPAGKATQIGRRP
jgi:WD40 repeat protein